MNFSTPAEYLAALRTDPTLAIIPIRIATESLDISRQALERRANLGDIEMITIGDKTRAVRASSINAHLTKRIEQVERVRKFLIETAKKGETVVYGPVMAAIGLKTQSPPDRDRIGKILGEISDRSYDEDEFLLSALVFNKAENQPSPPFFALGKKHHKAFHKGKLSNAQFLAEQLQKIYARYRP